MPIKQPRSRKSTLVVLTLLALLATLIPPWTAQPTSADETAIKINEVESNGGTPGDWVEFFNTGLTEVDLSGFVFRDNDDGHTYTLPANTTIGAGAFLVIDEADFGFGLGGADSARLFMPDGSTLIDSYEWETHATTTYGLCPDGTGAFTTTTTPTKGSANDCSISVYVNEIESNGGTPGDWVEFINLGPVAVDLAGFIFKDNDDGHAYALPSPSLIAAGGYLVIDEADFGFGLGGADSARLFQPDGTTLVDSYEWESHATTTYGRCPNGTGDFETTSGATKGAANDCGGAADAVKINEVESSGGTPGDWVEFFNTGPTEVDLGGYIFKDNDDAHAFALPSSSVIAPGGYLVIEEADFGFGLGQPDSARLFMPDGTTLVDTYAWDTHATTTYGRCPNGTGEFTTTESVTKGAANDCGSVPTSVKINEIESSGGVPGDWVELYNTGGSAVDLSGWIVRDNDDTHTAVLANGTMIGAGEFFIVEEAMLGFGLGSPDAVRLFAPDGTTLLDTYSWTPHASTTYGRCPDGTGEFTTTTSVTKGAANDCSVPVKINEVESSGGVPGDWVELYNPSPNPVDISGFVFRDNDDGHSYVIPAATMLAGAGYYLLEEADFGFGLGQPDSARLFAPDGTTLVDSYAWDTHAATTYGRCPNGTGEFATTTAVTKGTANACPGEITPDPWPGGPDVAVADEDGAFGGNMSGLAYQASGTGAPGVLWASRNGPGALFRLLWDGTAWIPDSTNDWGAGKALRYTDGTGDPDAEGVTFGASVSGGIYVATERDNTASSVSRNSILRFDVSEAGPTLTATHEWNLTADLPPNGANTGLEAITWIPDDYLVAQGFLDESTGLPYDPDDYPDHAGGLFFVGVEVDGMIYAFALNHTDNTFTKIASIDSGFISVMALEFDRDLKNLWAVCDDGCLGRTTILEINEEGKYEPTTVYERPAGMPNLNNEGFAIASQAECAANLKPVFWADDTGTDGHALRGGTLTCADTDGDGYPDALEVELGKDPNTYCDLMRADTDNDGAISIFDLAAVAGAFGQAIPPASSRLNQDKDGSISIFDLAAVAGRFGMTIAGCP